MTAPLNLLRQALIALNARGGEATLRRDARRLVLGAGRAGPGLGQKIESLVHVATLHAAETASWVQPQDAAQGGRFDACDLRAWLALAGAAGIPVVPAQEILLLSEDEMSAASGTMALPDAEAPGREGLIGRRLQSALRTLPATPQDTTDRPPNLDPDALQERLMAALDDVPEGWMVRHARCGPSTLKALVGSGVAEPHAPAVPFGANIEVGPGWVRVGNRRQVDVADQRTLSVGVAPGPDGPQAFLARPWITAARWLPGEDPHRAGSRFAGPGLWPAEWRVFIEGGRVIGVSSYYAWAGGTAPIDARRALQARDIASRLVAEMVRRRAVPGFADLEIARDNPHVRPLLDRRFPRDGIACTLDFLEGPDGLLLLEAGPAFMPIGGGFPCAFAGLEVPEGVGLRPRPGVNLGDPKTWARNTPRDGCILSWEEAESLAAKPVPEPPSRPAGPRTPRPS